MTIHIEIIKDTWLKWVCIIYNNPHALAWPGLAWLGLAWLGLAWLGLAWLGLAWLGLAWLGLAHDKYSDIIFVSLQKNIPQKCTIYGLESNNLLYYFNLGLNMYCLTLLVSLFKGNAIIYCLPLKTIL